MKHNKWVVIISAVIAGTLLLFLLMSILEYPTGFVVEEQEFIKILPDTIEIEKNDLTYCCQISLPSQNRGCWVLNKYNCDYCKPYCDE